MSFFCMRVIYIGHFFRGVMSSFVEDDKPFSLS